MVLEGDKLFYFYSYQFRNQRRRFRLMTDPTKNLPAKITKASQQIEYIAVNITKLLKNSTLHCLPR
ncbi:MAG: hypothetical protein Q6364_03440, partial [Candidatus Hermodarchaeota archaeon]|nr:hypothetical protein [Candidatus Hermodarchaeota archaeon]